LQEWYKRTKAANITQPLNRRSSKLPVLQILGRPLRIDHVENYRLPKHLQEKKAEGNAEGNDISFGPGHAYHGQELASSFDVKAGHDLFTSPPNSMNDRNGKNAEEKDATEAKRARKESKAQKRREKEVRRAARSERKRERRSNLSSRGRTSSDESDEATRDRQRKKRHKR